MAPDRSDVQSMVIALFTLIGSMDRAARQSAGASTLSLLQAVASRDAIRPSEIADLQHVHPSLVTRQVRDLEDKGYAQVTADPADGRSCLVTLTPPAPRRWLASARPAWTGLPRSWPTGSPRKCGP